MNRDSQGSSSTPPRVRVERRGALHHMTFPAGHIDGHAVRMIYEQAVAAADDGHARLLIDLTEVSAISSSAMGMIITVRKKLVQAGGIVAVLAPNPYVRQAFAVTRLDEIVPVESSEHAATARLTAHA